MIIGMWAKLGCGLTKQHASAKSSGIFMYNGTVFRYVFSDALYEWQYQFAYCTSDDWINEMRYMYPIGLPWACHLISEHLICQPNGCELYRCCTTQTTTYENIYVTDNSRTYLVTSHTQQLLLHATLLYCVHHSNLPSNYRPPLGPSWAHQRLKHVELFMVPGWWNRCLHHWEHEELIMVPRWWNERQHHWEHDELIMVPIWWNKRLNHWEHEELIMVPGWWNRCSHHWEHDELLMVPRWWNIRQHHWEHVKLILMKWENEIWDFI